MRPDQRAARHRLRRLRSPCGLLRLPEFEQAYLVEAERVLKCGSRTCHGPVRIAVIHDGKTERRNGMTWRVSAMARSSVRRLLDQTAIERDQTGVVIHFDDDAFFAKFLAMRGDHLVGRRLVLAR